MGRLLMDTQKELALAEMRLRRAGLPYDVFENWHRHVCRTRRSDTTRAHAAIRASTTKLMPVLRALHAGGRGKLADEIERRLASSIAPLRSVVDDYQLALARQRALKQLGGTS